MSFALTTKGDLPNATPNQEFRIPTSDLSFELRIKELGAGLASVRIIFVYDLTPTTSSLSLTPSAQAEQSYKVRSNCYSGFSTVLQRERRSLQRER